MNKEKQTVSLLMSNDLWLFIVQSVSREHVALQIRGLSHYSNFVLYFLYFAQEFWEETCLPWRASDAMKGMRVRARLLVCV